MSAKPEINEDKQSAQLLRAANAHTGPALSTPTIRVFPEGAKLQVINREHGWIHVVDPATSQQGWIYEEYFASDGRAPSEQEAPLPPNIEGVKPPKLHPRGTNWRSRSMVEREQPGGSDDHSRRWGDHYVSPPQDVDISDEVPPAVLWERDRSRAEDQDNLPSPRRGLLRGLFRRHAEEE